MRPSPYQQNSDLASSSTGAARAPGAASPAAARRPPPDERSGRQGAAGIFPLRLHTARTDMHATSIATATLRVLTRLLALATLSASFLLDDGVGNTTEPPSCSALKSDDTAGSPPPHINVPQWLSMFNPDFDAAGQHPFANLGCSGSIEELVSANAKYGMKGFLSIQNSGIWAPPATGYQNLNETGLQDGWLQNLTAVLTAAEPHLRSGTLAGIFLGDERCCSGIPFSNVTSVADAVKRSLQRTAPHALVYINECEHTFCAKANPSISCWGDSVPDSIDLISLDIYHSVANTYHDPATEVNTTRDFINAHVAPLLNPRQKLFVVPGTFGDYNVSRSGPIEQQQAGIVAKLNGYWDWAQSDPLIAGINWSAQSIVMASTTPPPLSSDGTFDPSHQR